MTQWRRRGDCFPDLIANANDSFVDLTPASQAPAATVDADWAAWLPGGTVPLIWERVYDDGEPCDYR